MKVKYACLNQNVDRKKLLCVKHAKRKGPKQLPFKYVECGYHILS
jgi:hypothetical protein